MSSPYLTVRYFQELAGMTKKKRPSIRGLVSKEFTSLIDQALVSFESRKDLDQEKLRKMLSSKKDLNEIFKALEDEVTDFFLKKFTAENFRNENIISKKNSQTITDLHEDLFQYFFAYIHTCHTVYNNFLNKIESSGVKASDLETKDLINLVMYGNLCRMADQIGVELINGYPDAALILWRTFYEYCVVATFLILRDSNRLASRFRAFSKRQNKRKVESYTKRQEDMKFPPLHVDIIKSANRNYKKVEKTYGKDFFENDYSWAKPYLKTKANFLAMEEAAGFGRFRTYYIWASGKAHPTYDGITDFRDSTNATVLKYITIQESDRRSQVDPSQLTLSALHQVNDYFLFQYSGHEYVVNMKMFRKIYDKFGEALSEENVAKTDPVKATNTQPKKT